MFSFPKNYLAIFFLIVYFLFPLSLINDTLLLGTATTGHQRKASAYFSGLN
jgi:hypothetical protein